MAGFICNRVRGAEAEAAAFAGYTELRRPLPDRESRILGRDPDRAGSGTCYGAYEIALAVRADEREHNGSRRLYVLMRNGSGVSVLALGNPYDGGAMQAALEAMPEAALYALLYTIWCTADGTAEATRTETARRYAAAFVDKRLKKRRKGGQVFVDVQPWYEASASPEGEPPRPVPGRYPTAESAFAAAKAAHPDCKSFSASPRYI